MKILYLMHVDWNWIKQRPHFIAEYLQESGCEVDVYCLKSYTKHNLVNNTSKVGSIHSIPRLPFNRFSLINKINKIIYSFFLKKILRSSHYDYVYITHPDMYCEVIKNKILYDCMDDCAEFPMSAHKKNAVLDMESKLLHKSSIVLFSADHLSEVVRNRSRITPLTFKTVNNAINLVKTKCKVSKRQNMKLDNNLILTYIGTISEWFDFNLLKNVQSKYNDKHIIFNIYGPSVKTFNYDFLNFKGLVKHEKIFEVMAESDVLIMPFIVNDLIKSVNPVKLYEYIYSCKPVISVRYSETEKFRDYVYLYESSDVDSFVNQLTLIKENNYLSKANKQDSCKFVENNTWKHRVDDIINLMTNY